MAIQLKSRVGVEWIHNFPMPCNQATLDYYDEITGDFLKTMENHGHIGVFNWGQSNAWETDFRHPDFGGDSLNWSDNVHFCYFADHGGNWGNTFYIAFASQHDSCLGSSAQWLLGSKSLKWFVADTCRLVLNLSVEHIAAVWFPPGAGVHLVMGYIDEQTTTYWIDSLGSDFGGDIAGGDAIAGSWVERAYSYWLGDNPIAIAYGANQAEAVSRRDNETLDWRDIPVVRPSWMAWKWKD